MLDKPACAPFSKERRMMFAVPSKLNRNPGGWGTSVFVVLPAVPNTNRGSSRSRFLSGSRMKFAEPTKFNRKSRVAQWSDLQSPHIRPETHVEGTDSFTTTAGFRFRLAGVFAASAFLRVVRGAKREWRKAW